MSDLTSQDGIEQTPKTIYLKDYTPPDYQVSNINLVFELDRATTRVTSTLQVKRMAAGTPPLVLNGQALTLVSVALNDNVLAANEYQLSDEQLCIHHVPEEFELTVVTEIHPEQNTTLEGLYASSSMLCTQCEAEGFRRITYFPDRPDVMSRYRVKLIADKQTCPVLLSNGNLLESGELDNGKHYAVWDDPSLKPSYLFALVAGDLVYIEDHFITMNQRDVTLRLYTEAKNQHKCDHAMASLKQAMLWDEQTYGREYDLDIYMIVAVDDFNMGAMENKGLNIFNSSCVLASPQTATDNDFYNIQSIIGHEYFHNWSGNRVTCRDWFQLSLKEGFTVFRDQEFSSDLNSRAVKRIDDVNVLRVHQFAEDSGPMAHPVRPDHFIEISNFYTVTVYDKGAEVVRMIRNLVGEAGFRQGTDLYFERHDGQAVTCDDFVKAMEDANQIDLTQFKRWYSQAGTPELTLSQEYDARQQIYRLTVEQNTKPTPGQDSKAPFHIPFAVGLLNAQGQDIPVRLASGDNLVDNVLQVRQEKQEFIFQAVPEKPVLSPLRSFSAPVKIQLSRTEEELAFLLANDSDAFNRWDAGQQLAIQILMAQIKAYADNKPMPEPHALTKALSQAMQDTQIDKALLSMMLTLPSESYLADQCEMVEVDAIYQARLFTRRHIAQQLQQQFASLYQANHSAEPYNFNDQEMARRGLKNVCLGYLAETQQTDYLDLCYQQYNQADNMTEVQAALSILAQHDTPLREQALAAFYEKWQDDAQVVDKWFGIQASSRLENTLQQVQQLMTHPAFNIKNPNKLRALVGAFCRGNPVRFHQLDGAGYQFLTDIILQVDKLNPQITARLVQVISNWRRYAEPRRGLMQQALQDILNDKALSKDTYEVVSKSLAS